MKVDIFRELDRFVTADGAILASNTSSIPIMKLGTATKRPEQVIGIHFFNPVPGVAPRRAGDQPDDERRDAAAVDRASRPTC